MPPPITLSWRQEQKDEIDKLNEGINDLCNSMGRARNLILLYIIWRKQLVQFANENDIQTEPRSELYELRQKIQIISDACTKLVEAYQKILEFYESKPKINVYYILLIKKYIAKYKKFKKNLSRMILWVREIKKGINAVDTKIKFQNLGSDISTSLSKIESNIENFQANLQKLTFNPYMTAELKQIKKNLKDANTCLKNLDLGLKRLSEKLAKLNSQSINEPGQAFDALKELETFIKLAKLIEKFDKEIEEMKKLLKELKKRNLNEEIKAFLLTCIELGVLMSGFWAGFYQIYIAYRAAIAARSAIAAGEEIEV
jgi:hypothetical protein